MNFILRVVETSNFPEFSNKKPTPIVNKILGEGYQIVLKSIHQRTFEALSNSFHTPEGVELFGVVVQDDGRKHGLWSTATYYIMTENGTTFEKIHTPEGTNKA